MNDIRPLYSSRGFYTSAAYVQLEFGESAASIRVRLLIKCGFCTRLYGSFLQLGDGKLATTKGQV